MQLQNKENIHVLTSKITVGHLEYSAASVFIGHLKNYSFYATELELMIHNYSLVELYL